MNLWFRGSFFRSQVARHQFLVDQSGLRQEFVRLLLFPLPVPVAARSKAYVYFRSPAEIVVSDPTKRHGCLVCCECCVLSSRGLWDELIARPEKSYRLCCVVGCDLENLVNEGGPWPAWGRNATGGRGEYLLFPLPVMPHHFSQSHLPSALFV